MKLILPVVIAFMFASPFAAKAQVTPHHEVADFIKEDKFRSIAISPKGTYIALTVPMQDKTILVVIKPGESKAVSRIDVKGKKTHIVGVTWVTDERLIYSVAVRDQLIEDPIPTGEVWAIDADGRSAKQLAGFRPSDSNFNARAGGPSVRETVQINVIDTLPADEDNIIAAVYRYGTDYTTVERVNVNRGSRLKISQAPVPNAGFLTDNAGRVRFAMGAAVDGFSKLYYRKTDDANWQLMNDESVSSKVVTPVGFSQDDGIAYLLSNEKTGPDAVVGYDTATATSKTLIRDPMVNHASMINAIGKRYPIGVVYSGQLPPRYVYFDPESSDAKAHQGLQRAFQGQIVSVGNRITTKNEVLVFAYGDREPGAYYVMNLDTRRVDPLMFTADGIQPDKLAPMRDIVFEARDGRKIPGYLTIPLGSSGKNIPMVVYPHGGPFNVQDRWRYDRNVQMLASHGYAVLQVNYRGSSGHGREHALAGYKQWGLTMQDDLTDATRWAISEGIADKNAICIFGASYGGYAALMGAAKEPDLYRCAIGQVGVYDLAMMKAEKSVANSANRYFFAMSLNDSDLAAVSPNKIAAQIKIPVFLSAGREDETAPVEHTEKMEAALKAAGVPVETLYFPTEGHGIYDPEHRGEFYVRLLTFLNKHIGGRAPVTPASPGKGGH